MPSFYIEPMSDMQNPIGEGTQEPRPTPHAPRRLSIPGVHHSGRGPMGIPAAHGSRAPSLRLRQGPFPARHSPCTAQSAAYRFICKLKMPSLHQRAGRLGPSRWCRHFRVPVFTRAHPNRPAARHSSPSEKLPFLQVVGRAREAHRRQRSVLTAAEIFISNRNPKPFPLPKSLVSAGGSPRERCGERS